MKDTNSEQICNISMYRRAMNLLKSHQIRDSFQLTSDTVISFEACSNESQHVELGVTDFGGHKREELMTLIKELCH